MIIKMFEKVGVFAANKDVARELRVGFIVPALENKKTVTVDFEKVEGATQSFIHALISDVIRKFGMAALDQVIFKSCNENIQEIVSIVFRYMQAGLEEDR